MTGHSPTCVTVFGDNEVIRMSVWSADGAPDLHRGIRLARIAYQNRMAARLRKRGQLDPDNPAPIELPTIAELHFESADGEIVSKYTAEEIMEAAKC
jgi:hypothetical protein